MANPVSSAQEFDRHRVEILVYGSVGLLGEYARPRREFEAVDLDVIRKEVNRRRVRPDVDGIVVAAKKTVFSKIQPLLADVGI